MRERSEGWSHASRAARIEGRTAGRSPRNDPDTYATAGAELGAYRSQYHALQGTRRHQELDPETGLYAFPARNYDPRTSRWLSADPALEEYLPEPGQKPGDLVGMGGVYNYANLAVYHYGGNNPLKYVIQLASL